MTERHHDGYLISTDPDRLDRDLIHRWISEESYWARGRSRETVMAPLQASLNFGAYVETGEMVGAARVVTDCTTFGWLCDIFVIEDHRGRGLGKALVAAIVEDPQLADLQRIILATADAHDLYGAYGSKPMGNPAHWMERCRPVS